MPNLSSAALIYLAHLNMRGMGFPTIVWRLMNKPTVHFFPAAS